MSPLTLLAIALGLSSLLMLGVWVVAMRIRNAGIVDIAWALGFAPLALLYRVFAAGEPARQNLVTLMVVLWSVRLGHHLWKRVMGHHPVEDGRYAEMRLAVAGREGVTFFWFFQAQAVLLALLSVPGLLINADPRVHLGITDFLGVLLWIVALGGESLADRQLAAFKADPANRGKVCDTGLWRLSRHPNYFFEWLIWVALFVMALPAPWGVFTLFAPALMLFLLLKVTGIPYTEHQAVRSKGDAYRRYQQTTSAFFPWFPKEALNKSHDGR
jgi:steroid 5-alpha reductase family enzyme